MFAGKYLRSSNYKLTLEPSQIVATLLEKDEDYFLREEKILIQIMRSGGLYIDVGSNIGHLSLAVASNIPNCQIIAIEANPSTFQILERNILINSLSVQAYNVAVGDHDLISTTITSSHLDSCNSVDDSRYLDRSMSEQDLYLVDKGKPVQVQMRTLDSMANQYNWPKTARCIKIDIEGFELFALRGAKNLLKNTCLVYFEYWDKLSLKYGYSLTEIYDFFGELSFHIYYIPDEAPVNDVFKEMLRLPRSASLTKNTNLIAINSSYFVYGNEV